MRQHLFFLSFSAVLLALLIWRLPINGWGSLIWLAGMVGLYVLRAPHQTVAQNTTTERTYHETSERVLLILVGIGTQVLPALQLVTGLFAFADRPGSQIALGFGTIALLLGLWLFWRSHVDLGRNWSVTLEVREAHKLVTHGVYARIRHPMYTAIFLICIAQALLISNWIAGPAAVIAFGIMCYARIPLEEKMMAERFGEDFDTYRKMTSMLVPSVF